MLYISRIHQAVSANPVRVSQQKILTSDMFVKYVKPIQGKCLVIVTFCLLGIHGIRQTVLH